MSISLSVVTTVMFPACKTAVDSTNDASVDKSGQYRHDVEIYKGIPEIVYPIPIRHLSAYIGKRKRTPPNPLHFVDHRKTSGSTLVPPCSLDFSVTTS